MKFLEALFNFKMRSADRRRDGYEGNAKHDGRDPNLKDNEIKCPKCEKPVPSESNHCPRCGANMVSLTQCNHCGTKFLSRALFCQECGTKIM